MSDIKNTKCRENLGRSLASAKPDDWGNTPGRPAHKPERIPEPAIEQHNTSSPSSKNSFPIIKSPKKSWWQM